MGSDCSGINGDELRTVKQGQVLSLETISMCVAFYSGMKQQVKSEIVNVSKRYVGQECGELYWSSCTDFKVEGDFIAPPSFYAMAFCLVGFLAWFIEHT